MNEFLNTINAYLIEELEILKLDSWQENQNIGGEQTWHKHNTLPYIKRFKILK